MLGHKDHEKQKLRSEQKEKMHDRRRAQHAQRAHGAHQDGFTGSAEEQARAGRKVVKTQMTAGIDACTLDEEEDEEDVMALVRKKQMGRQSWQDLDQVSSKLQELEASTPSQS